MKTRKQDKGLDEKQKERPRLKKPYKTPKLDRFTSVKELTEGLPPSLTPDYGPLSF